MNNITDVVKGGLCTGCGTCVGLCPQDIITMEINHEKGIYLPNLNEGCNDCGICLKVCPGHEVDFIGLNKEIFGKKAENILIGHYENCYVGYSCDQDLRFAATSGGMVTQILLYLLEEKMIDGALVTRMKKNNPLEPEPFIARTKEDIINSKGSKYCPVPANIALKTILKSEEGEKFAVVGLPCHMQSIRKAEQLNIDLKEKIILHIGLWCSGTCNFKGTDFLLKKLGIKSSSIHEINYRGDGWPGSLNIILKNGNERNITLEQYYDSNFMSFIDYRCYLCTDCNTEFADISMGDYRGNDVYLKEKNGKSAIITRTIFAENLLKKMNHNNSINLKKTTFDDISTLQSYFYSKKKVGAIFDILKILGRKLPKYNQELLNSSFSTYILGIIILIRLSLASKNHFHILVIYNTIVKKISFKKL